MRGWYGESVRHKLAAQGIKTVTDTKTFTTVDVEVVGEMIADKLKETNIIHPKNILNRSQSENDMVMVNFHLEETDTDSATALSDVIYRWNNLLGMIRFPKVDKDCFDEVDNKLKNVEEKFDFIERTHYRKNFGTTKMTPHFKFEFENVRKKYINEHVDEVLEAVNEVLEVYE